MHSIWDLISWTGNRTPSLPAVEVWSLNNQTTRVISNLFSKDYSCLLFLWLENEKKVPCCCQNLWAYWSFLWSTVSLVLGLRLRFFFFQGGFLFLDSRSQAGACVTHVDVESECVWWQNISHSSVWWSCRWSSPPLELASQCPGSMRGKREQWLQKWGTVGCWSWSQPLVLAHLGKENLWERTWVLRKLVQVL